MLYHTVYTTMMGIIYTSNTLLYPLLYTYIRTYTYTYIGTCFAAISDFNNPTTTYVELLLFTFMGVAPVLFWSTVTAGLAPGATYLYVIGGMAYACITYY